MKPWRLAPALATALYYHAPWSLLWATLKTSNPEEFSPTFFVGLLSAGIDNNLPEEFATNCYALLLATLGQTFFNPFRPDWLGCTNTQAWQAAVVLADQSGRDEPAHLRQLCQERVLNETLREPQAWEQTLGEMPPGADAEE